MALTALEIGIFTLLSNHVPTELKTPVIRSLAVWKIDWKVPGIPWKKPVMEPGMPANQSHTTCHLDCTHWPAESKKPPTAAGIPEKKPPIEDPTPENQSQMPCHLASTHWPAESNHPPIADGIPEKKSPIF